jgi:hypothetical protein
MMTTGRYGTSCLSPLKEKSLLGLKQGLKTEYKSYRPKYKIILLIIS